MNAAVAPGARARGASRRGPRAGDEREPRARLRHARPRAERVRRARRHRAARGRARDRGRRARARRTSRATPRTSSCARSRTRTNRSDDGCRGCASYAQERHPARARARLVRRRGGVGPPRREGSARGRRRARPRTPCCASRPSWRATPTTSRRRSSAVSRSRGSTTAGPQHKKLLVHRGVSPLVLVPEFTMSTKLARSLQPTAGAPRGRRLQRVALGAAHRGADAEPRAAAGRDRGQAPPELPRERHARDRRARARRCARRASRRSCRGRVRACSCSPTGPGDASRRRLSLRPRPTPRGRRSCSPSTSRVVQ